MVRSDLESLLTKARELDSGGRHEEARMAYLKYIGLEDGDAGAWADYGGLLMVMDRLGEAEEACRRALVLNPGHSAGMVNLAGTLLKSGRIDEAEFMARRARLKEPRSEVASLAMIDCLMARKALGAARGLLEDLLQRSPGCPGAMARLENLCILQGDWARLRPFLERQLGVHSGREAEYQRGHLQILYGEMRKGWASYEARLDVPGRILPERHFPQPRWRGESFPGKVLLVHYEQGCGDTLMFLRYLPMVKARGGTVHLMVQPELVAVARTCPGSDAVFPEGADLAPLRSPGLADVASGRVRHGPGFRSGRDPVLGRPR